MGVYIRNMNMPESCDVCPIVDACYTTAECPLIPVPDHGDLIDRDALEKELIELSDDEWNKKTGTSWARAFEEAADVVYNAPVVIPAERGEDGET